MVIHEKKSFNELAEQFTLQGFIMVSLIALGLGISGTAPILMLISNLEFNIQNISICYGITWLICFWIFCLYPKMKGEK